MRKLIKSIVIRDSSDYTIVKHHIKKLGLDFECEFKEGNVIDFFDDYLYQIVREFMSHTKIKSKINKDI